MRPMFSYVQAYLRLGWQPIPVYYAVNDICSCRLGAACQAKGKHPIPPGWQKDAIDEDELERYWLQNEHYNIGLVTGQRTNLVVLDIDVKHNGYESLSDLETKHGALPKTITANTGGGGKHFFFQYPAGMLIPNKGNLCPGLDIRGEGGQVVAMPSYHNDSKNRYTWAKGLTPSDIVAAPMPEWLIGLIQDQESVWVSSIQTGEETANTYYGGTRNNSLFRMGCRLRVIKDLNPEELGRMLHDLNQSKCQPPLDKGEVDLIIGSVLRKEAKHVVVKKNEEGKKPRNILTLSLSTLWSNEEEPTIDYVIPNLLAEGEVCLLASPTEAGKSILAMSLSLSVATGSPAWGGGTACPKGRVMYCTEELDTRTIKSRLRKLARGLGVDPETVNDDNILIIPQQDLSLSLRHPENIEALKAVAQEFKPTLIVLDTFVSYFGAPEKDSDANRAWFNAVPIALRALTGCAVIIQHHTRKLSRGDDGRLIGYTYMSDDELNNEIRGSSDLAGVCERVWFIWKKSEERNDFGPDVQINFRNTKARRGDKHEMLLLVMKDPDEKSTTIQRAIGAKGKRFMEIEHKLREVLFIGEEVDKAELVRRLKTKNVGASQSYEWLAKFVDSGILKMGGSNNYTLNKSMETIF